MEIAAGEPLYPGDERRVFTEALVLLWGNTEKYARGALVFAVADPVAAAQNKGVVLQLKQRDGKEPYWLQGI